MRLDVGEVEVGLKLRVSVFIFHDGHVFANLVEDVLEGVSFAEGLEGHIEAALWFSAEQLSARVARRSVRNRIRIN